MRQSETIAKHALEGKCRGEQKNPMTSRPAEKKAQHERCRKLTGKFALCIGPQDVTDKTHGSNGCAVAKFTTA